MHTLVSTVLKSIPLHGERLVRSSLSATVTQDF